MDYKVTANDIMDLLTVKHSKDVFVPECKNGPSYGGGMVRMDAWAMRRSWANPCYFGYEIKISRSDFVNDQKWPAYLGLCNQFSFVCPHGVIGKDELPSEVGLLVVAKTGTRLFTKKKAPHRTIEEPVELLLYLLMARMRVCGPYEFERKGKFDYWKDWLEDKEKSLTIGTRCSEKLSAEYKKQVYDVQRQNDILESRIKSYDDVAGICKDLGIEPSQWMYKDGAQRKIAKAMAVIPPEFSDNLQKLSGQIKIMTDQIKSMENEIAKDAN